MTVQIKDEAAITTLAGTESFPLDNASNQTKRITGANLATQMLALGNVVSGAYTPTLTNTTNIDASTAYACQYVRIGSVVIVSGKVDIDATAAGSVVMGMSLPVASDFAAPLQLGGTFQAFAVAGGGAILADSVNNRATFQMIVADTANRSYHFMFMYTIV